MSYTYTKIKDLKAGEKKYHIYGVVKEFRIPFQTNDKGKYYGKISVIDETYLNPFGVSIFCRDGEDTMDIPVGSIVRLHRLKVEPFNDSIDGRIFSIRDLVLFPEEGNPREDWISCAKHISMTDSDFDRIIELRSSTQTLMDLDKFASDFMEEYKQ